ncbi:branched-chain amino acid transport system II carrier protein [Acidaminobacter sp. JC074]|uniref:branched-chain amino acid transport system II carrier protein n=1 Tax=Acidaminobacter sp. JC074 TaxID=2530199 RepID=UPI001F0D85A2|nr:branched-chain amino acid transport system II carrier protein [Acidaminobacter sp. JC074]MCH4888963.1 branched-chain amino acid transport system II carrier protein [Acidaminobacter sp. JC074]
MKKTDILILGLALFAMFFGAGNLIFPPAIGNLAGSDYILAIIGFFITGIGMPILGIMAVIKAGGSISDFGKHVGPTFSTVFGLIIALILGPFMGVPRTGATTFEMGIQPILPSVPAWIIILIFFALTWLLSIKQSSIIDIIGKWMTPILVTLLVFIVGLGIFKGIGSPITQNKDAFKIGFTGGYQTMDLFVAIMLGSIILKTLKDKGYHQSKFFSITWRAGIIAAIGLALIYGGLLVLGANGQTLLAGIDSRSLMTVTIVQAILGNIGSILLGVCVSFACLTTSIGITAAASEFFDQITPKYVKYNMIVTLSVIVSGLMAMGGVEFIVSVAGPLLTIIYPMGIVLVFLNLFGQHIKHKSAFKWTVVATSLISLPQGLSELGILTQTINELLELLPLNSLGLPWVIPAIIGFGLANIYYESKNRTTKKRIQPQY